MARALPPLLVVPLFLLTRTRTAAAYDQRVGLLMAHLEKAVYCGKDRFERWDVGDAVARGPKVDASRVRFVDSAATHGAAGVGRMREPEGCFVAIRGTLGTVSSFMDAMFWMKDFGRPSCPGCEVDFGFKLNYESLKDGIFRALKDLGCARAPLHLVGHSLGAAGLSYLLYDALEAGMEVTHMYALESPRPGNLAFSEALRQKARAVDAWRVAHYKDAVVHLPPRPLGYAHALPEIYYGNRTGTHYRECGVEEPSCSAHWSLFETTGRDHDWYVDIDPCSCTNETRTPPPAEARSLLV